MLDAEALNNVLWEEKNKTKARKASTNIRSRNRYFFLKAELIVAGVCTLALFKKADIK